MCAGDSMKWRGSGTGIGAFSATADMIQDIPLVHFPLAEFRLGGVDIGAVALRVDEGIHRVLCRLARDELAIPAPRSRARRHPDVSGKAAEHAQAALDVGPLFWIPHPERHTTQGAGADHVQYAFTVADGERPRGAAARAAASDVRGERDRPDTDRVAVLEPVIDARRRESEDPDLDESPERKGDVGVVAARGDDAGAPFTCPQLGAGRLLERWQPPCLVAARDRVQDHFDVLDVE